MLMIMEYNYADNYKWNKIYASIKIMNNNFGTQDVFSSGAIIKKKLF